MGKVWEIRRADGEPGVIYFKTADGWHVDNWQTGKFMTFADRSTARDVAQAMVNRMNRKLGKESRQ